jgi:hypothetical protein
MRKKFPHLLRSSKGQICHVLKEESSSIQITSVGILGGITLKLIEGLRDFLFGPLGRFFGNRNISTLGEKCLK